MRPSQFYSHEDPFMHAIFKRFGTMSMAPPAGPYEHCVQFTWY